MNPIDQLKDAQGRISQERMGEIIPYSAPFLLIDAVTLLEKERIKATKYIRRDEAWVGSHFTDFPIMPGVLITEALAQAGTILIRYNLLDHKEQDILAHTFKEVRFFHPVFPGDEIHLDVRMLNIGEKTALLQGSVFVRDILCSTGEFLLAIVNKKRFREKFSNRSKVL